MVASREDPTSIQMDRSIEINCFRKEALGIFAALPRGLLLLALFGFMAPAAPAATLLLQTNFGPGVTLGAPYSFYANGAWQDLLGKDLETGFSFPPTLLNANFFGVQLITSGTVTADTIGDHISNEIRTVLGPSGTPVYELAQAVKIKGPVGEGDAQAPLILIRDWHKGDVNDLYISYWFKHQADLKDQLDNTVSAGNWRVQFQFKTGGYLNDWPGDYRISTIILKSTTDGTLYWQTKGDNVANGPWDRVDYWSVENHTVPVPVDAWFFFEVYWHRSSGTDGRYWAAVNGQVIVDHRGPNMGDEHLPITRIMSITPYSGGHTPVESQLTKLSIWSNFPCGEGVSCYQFPSTPAGLKIK